MADGRWWRPWPMMRREAVTGSTRALRCRGWHERADPSAPAVSRRWYGYLGIAPRTLARVRKLRVGARELVTAHEDASPPIAPFSD
eukprot:2381715-Prymnesium_polylepis.1